MKRIIIIVLIFTWTFASSTSQGSFKTIVDDSHLSAPSTTINNFDGNLGWDETRIESIESGAEFQLLRKVGEEITPVVGLRFLREETGQVYHSNENGVVRIPLCMEGGSYILRLETDNDYFDIRESLKPYSRTVTLKCFERLVATVYEDTATGQILGIWDVAYSAMLKLKSQVGLEFWKEKIKFHWPASSDYYSFNGNVYISSGHHWDVVAHEMGHAIYDQANIGDWGGGQHYIDRCYSKALALSEGWASFFAAFVMLDKADVDAKFMFMVPRRAPVRIEHVPEDVCREVTNEWRVASFLWDVYDHNVDEEDSKASFETLWSVSKNSSFLSIEEFFDALKSSGVDQGYFEQAWKRNF